MLAEEDGGVGVGQQLRGPLAGEQGALADGGRPGRAQELPDDAFVEDCETGRGTEGTLLPACGQDLLDVRGRRGRVGVCNERTSRICNAVRGEKRELNLKRRI